MTQVASRTDLRAAVLEALGGVQDPELHEGLTSLGFVDTCTVEEDGTARVRLRLPTYFCAPNFAFLMVADAWEAVSAVPGVRRADVTLEDHFASDVINAGVAARAGFVDSFAGEAVAELDELRAGFLRKAVLAGTDLVCGPLVAGRPPEELLALDLGDVPPSAELDRLRARRRELGLPADDAAPLLVDVESGRRLDAGDLTLHLRKARLTQVGVEANTSICRGQLQHRYAGSPSAGLLGQPGTSTHPETDPQTGPPTEERT